MLPGSFYIEMALSVHQELSKRAPGVVRNVTFQNPVILSPEDTIIRVEVRNSGAATAEYTFYEGAVGNGGASIRHQSCCQAGNRSQSISPSGVCRRIIFNRSVSGAGS